jgi:phosphatidylserine synthase 2
MGMKTCEYLSIKPYNWRGIKNIPTLKGKLVRCLSQFSPHSWIEYNWRPMASLKHWIIVLTIVFVYNLAEVGTFYLKLILWIPPDHFLCLGRVIFLLLCSSVAMREGYEYLTNPKCQRLGVQCWICSIILFTELMIVLKFDLELVSKPAPKHIIIIWKCIAAFIFIWTCWHFNIKKSCKSDHDINDTNKNNIITNEDESNFLNEAQPELNNFILNSK